jgi:Mg/Co/Ni transporter MgtE
MGKAHRIEGEEAMTEASMYSEAIGQRQLSEKAKLLESLREMPLVEYACKKSAIGRTTYYRWRKEDAAFLRESDEAMRHGIEFINDMSESQLIQLIKEKKMPAIAMWLKNRHPSYGAHRSLHPPSLTPPELTDEEARLFRKALGSGYGNAKQKRTR